MPTFPVRNHLLHFRTIEGFCEGIKCFDFVSLWLKCWTDAHLMKRRSFLNCSDQIKALFNEKKLLLCSIRTAIQMLTRQTTFDPKATLIFLSWFYLQTFGQMLKLIFFVFMVLLFIYFNLFVHFPVKGISDKVSSSVSTSLIQFWQG